MLEGTTDFVVEGESVTGGPEPIVVVPAGTVHSFKTASDGLTRQVTSTRWPRSLLGGSSDVLGVWAQLAAWGWLSSLPGSIFTGHSRAVSGIPRIGPRRPIDMRAIGEYYAGTS
jgi:hypothetical protein